MAKVVRQEEVATFKSKSRPGVRYTVLKIKDDENHIYYSCNCPAWTTSPKQKGKQAWERECKHTQESLSPRQQAAPPRGGRPGKGNRGDGDIGNIEL